MAGPVHNPATPYVAPIQGGLHDGMQIHVAGTAEAHHNGFLISLQSGGSIDPRSNTALAFNPRFADNQLWDILTPNKCEYGEVVRNSLQDGAWGAEERKGSFPFRKGQPFEVTIQVHDHSYKVSVDGRHFCDFNHRIPMQQVNHIAIEQGIRIKHICFDASTCLSCTGATPYVAPIQGVLHDGMQIHVAGTAEAHHNGFLISLQSGGSIDPRSNTALAFNPRFADNQVVRNSLQDGAWGAEERDGSFPFKKGQPFEVTIQVNHHSYKVSVDGQHFCDFNHRIPMQQVTHIAIEQGIRIKHILFATPYVAPIQGGLHDGMQIHVAGTAEAHHNGFLISLQSGGSIDPRSNTALAFNPRFADNQVVRNSLQDGAWGAEERDGSFPFRKGQPFEVTIQVNHHSYKVSVDGQHFCDFNHRIPMQQVTHIAIEQGIRIKHILFATPYVAPIQGVLHDGMQIHVAGTAEAHHNGFLISLQSGGSIDPRSNTALAFNPRFADNQVVRNSLQDGAWGAEERDGSFPFRKGQPFEVTIQVNHHSYKVSVDGRHFCDFNHRIPMQQVTHIAIEQGIRIKHILFKSATRNHSIPMPE